MTEIARLAWRNLWRNTRRTLLTLSAIAFGTFLAVLFTAMQDRSFADTIDLAARLNGGHVLLEHPEYLDMPTLTRTVDHADALRALASADPEVVRTVERITGQMMVQTATHQAGAAFVAFDPTDEDDGTLSFLEGVTGTLTDRKGIVLGQRLADNLQVGLGDKVVYTLLDRQGQIVSGMGRVSGMLRTGASSVDGGLMLVPIDDMRQVLGYGPDEATFVGVFLGDPRQSAGVSRRLSAGVPAGVRSLTWDEATPDLSGFIAMKVGGARFMELVILVLVAAGIFNTLFMSVMERSREFGILAAIGCSRARIFAMVMWESLWLGLVGLVAAVVVTAGPYVYLVRNGIDLSSKMGPEALEVAGIGFSPILRVGIFPENAVIIASFAMAATLLAGLWPAWRASRVEPVEAIHLV